MCSTLRRTAAALAIVTLLGMTSATARAEVIERVVAVVNGRAIMLSELRRRAAPFLHHTTAIPSSSQRRQLIRQMYAEVLERMVQEELLMQAAEARGITVRHAEVDRAIRNVQRLNDLSDVQFWEAVRGQGFTEEQYRADVRRQLVRLKVIHQRASGRVIITPQQVRQHYQQTVARNIGRSNVAYILIAVSNSASPADVAAARTRAEQVRASIRTVADFERTMTQVGGGELGWLAPGGPAGAFEEELRSLHVGDIGAPFRGPAGFMILLLRDREGAAPPAPFEVVRAELYEQLRQEAADQEEQRLLIELRRQAVIDVRL